MKVLCYYYVIILCYYIMFNLCYFTKFDLNKSLCVEHNILYIKYFFYFDFNSQF